MSDLSELYQEVILDHNGFAVAASLALRVPTSLLAFPPSLGTLGVP
ncbi:MAG TPA: hypothetical protein VFM35_01505 [Candidatus Binatia bacterium]|nr:hypothetical protein [Candidatus Binatia bacterium]